LYLKKHKCPNNKVFVPSNLMAKSVVEICKAIAKKTSMDYYGISQKLVLDNIDTLSPMIAHISNKSIESGGNFGRQSCQGRSGIQKQKP
jgi:hypothetical protein